MKNFVALATVVILSGAPQLVICQTCPSLKSILAATNDKYRSLRGGFDFFFNEHIGKVIPPPFTECFTQADDDSSEYRCWLRLPDNESTANRELANFTRELESCFGSQLVRRTGGQANRPSFRNSDTGESISLAVRRHVPKDADQSPRFMLSMRISNVD
jgi:hypothetical protein